MQVDYDWVGDLGLSALIMGAATHLAETGLVFCQTCQATKSRPHMIVTDTPVTAHGQYTAENNQMKEWYTIVQGFCQGIERKKLV